MTRPTPDSPFPYTRGDLASLAGVGVPTIKNIEKSRLIGAGRIAPLSGDHVRKKRRGGPGTGNWNGYDAEDAIRIMVAKALINVGVQVASIHSLFQSIQEPKIGKPWSWLRSSQAHDEGAALVLVIGHPLGPDPAHTGHAYLTTAHEAKGWLLSKRTVIVIDVGALIVELEERTGRAYDLPSINGLSHESRE